MTRVLAIVLALVLSSSLALSGELDFSKLPVRAKEHIPVLLEQIDTYWPEMTEPSLLCAQIETETCYGLKDRRCWNPTTELKTSREYGFGLGQITIAYDSRGRERFNNFDMVRQLHDDMRSWKWKDRFNALYQLRALVLYDRKLWLSLKNAENGKERYAMTFAAYNGGLGGLQGEIAMCRASRNCDPTKWFGNVEHHSKKSRKKYKGYGKSFFEINREYPRNIFGYRRPKYQQAGLK